MKNSSQPPKARARRASRPTLSRIVVLLMMLALVIGISTVVFSQSGQETHPRAKDFKDATPMKNGKKYVATREIIFDQASNALRKPTAEETQAMVDQISGLTNRSTEGLTVTDHSDGTQSMNLEGRFSSVVLGRARQDGSTEVRCVTTMEEAAEFLGLEEAASE